MYDNARKKLVPVFGKPDGKVIAFKKSDSTMIAAPASTGTNATSLNLTACGVPVVDIGLPLASMHTYNEVISMRDCETLARLVGEFISSEKIAEQMTVGEVELL